MPLYNLDQLLSGEDLVRTPSSYMSPQGWKQYTANTDKIWQQFYQQAIAQGMDPNAASEWAKNQYNQWGQAQHDAMEKSSAPFGVNELQGLAGPAAPLMIATGGLGASMLAPAAAAMAGGGTLGTIAGGAAAGGLAGGVSSAINGGNALENITKGAVIGGGIAGIGSALSPAGPDMNTLNQQAQQGLQGAGELSEVPPLNPQLPTHTPIPDFTQFNPDMSVPGIQNAPLPDINIGNAAGGYLYGPSAETLDPTGLGVQDVQFGANGNLGLSNSALGGSVPALDAGAYDADMSGFNTPPSQTLMDSIMSPAAPPAPVQMAQANIPQFNADMTPLGGNASGQIGTSAPLPSTPIQTLGTNGGAVGSGATNQYLGGGIYAPPTPPVQPSFPTFDTPLPSVQPPQAPLPDINIAPQSGMQPIQLASAGGVTDFSPTGLTQEPTPYVDNTLVNAPTHNYPSIDAGAYDQSMSQFNNPSPFSPEASQPGAFDQMGSQSGATVPAVNQAGTAVQAPVDQTIFGGTSANPMAGAGATATGIGGLLGGGTKLADKIFGSDTNGAVNDMFGDIPPEVRSILDKVVAPYTGGTSIFGGTPQPKQIPYGDVITAGLGILGAKNTMGFLTGLADKTMNADPWNSQMGRYQQPLYDAATKGIGNTAYGQSIADNTMRMLAAKGYGNSGKEAGDVAQALNSGTTQYIGALAPLAMGRAPDTRPLGQLGLAAANANDKMWAGIGTLPGLFGQTIDAVPQLSDMYKNFQPKVV